MKELLINGVIGYEVTSKDFIKSLNDCNGEDVIINIHSPGGSVFEGLAIYNAIRNYSGNVKIKVTGLAASMATVIAMAKGKPEVANSSVFMIHNVQSLAMGDYRDMKKMADICERMTNMLAQIYAKCTGTKLKDIRTMMDDTTYLYGQEIVDNKFADSIYDDGNDDNKNDATAMAQLELEDCIEKMRKFKENTELVAQLGDNFDMTDTSHSETPATAGQNNQEEISMTLKEFFESNPAAKAEYDAKVTASFDDGAKSTKASYDARINRAVAVMTAEASYPVQIKNIALDVIKGEKSVETLDAMVSAADMILEMQKSSDAKGEQKADGKMDDKIPASPDGIVKTDADAKTAVDELRAELGFGGKK